VETIKTTLVKKLEANNDENLSIFLTERFKKSYAVLSKTFSKREGITIEKYDINLRIEKAKELIQLKQLNFSEIAYSLNYKTSSHLAKQFKTVTGMSMTAYSNLKKGERKTLDQIV
jgi:AraC-like DNA-binding protein